MKTKKQKLPSKPRTIDEITGKPGGFKKFLKKQEREAKQAEARRQQRIKAARKPAHTEVFEGYGVMKENGNLIGLSFEPLPFFSISEMDAKFLQSETVVLTRVVKLRAEFKVI